MIRSRISRFGLGRTMRSQTPELREFSFLKSIEYIYHEATSKYSMYNKEIKNI